MKSVIIYFILIFSPLSIYSQSISTERIPEPCNDLESSPGLNTSYGQPKRFKRLKNKYLFEIEIKYVIIGVDEKVDTIRNQFVYSEKIKNETSLIRLNDSISLQFQLFRTSHNKQKNIYFKLKLLHKDDECWRSRANQNIEPIYSDSMNLGMRFLFGTVPVTLYGLIISIK